MKASFSALLLALLPSWVAAGTWYTDYAQALKEGTRQDKPVLVWFTTDGAAAQKQFQEMGSAADQFILLSADKSTPAGQKLYNLFRMPADQGCVVVERGQDWQYCRFERTLRPEELRIVLNRTAGAKGIPQTPLFDDTAIAVSATETVDGDYMPVNYEGGMMMGGGYGGGCGDCGGGGGGCGGGCGGGGGCGHSHCGHHHSKCHHEHSHCHSHGHHGCGGGCGGC